MYVLFYNYLDKPRSPSTASSTGERTIQLTSVTVNVFISTAGQLTITPPSTKLKTTRNGKSTLIISVTVPLGIILVLCIIMALIIYRCWKRRKNVKVSVQ